MAYKRDDEAMSLHDSCYDLCRLTWEVHQQHPLPPTSHPASIAGGSCHSHRMACPVPRPIAAAAAARLLVLLLVLLLLLLVVVVAAQV